MPRRPRYAPLNVFINSRLVGQFIRETSGAVSFRYDPTWLNWELAFPASLSLPLREQAYVGDPVNAVFDNLLPDNLDLRRRIAARVHASGTEAFNLLSEIGRDCIGALQFLPLDMEPGPAGLVEGTIVTEAEIENIISNVATAPLGNTADDEFRISIAGAQEKTALLLLDGKWYRPTGTTATTHIFKLPLGVLPNGIDLTTSVENEYLCLKLISALGLPSAAAEIATFGKHRVLVVERFDRLRTTDNRLLRVPQEDLCQALSLPSSMKYESDGGPGIVRITRLLAGSDTPEADQLMFLKANIAFWLLGAIDGHAKNFSVALLPRGGFNLTPLYDVLSAQPAVDSGQIRHNAFKLAMAVGENRHYVVNRIAPRHFFQTARLAGIGERLLNGIISELRDICPCAIETTLQNLPDGFPAPLAESISAGAKRRLANLETE
jgi:serine/threonine-protein kinase HipA